MPPFEFDLEFASEATVWQSDRRRQTVDRPSNRPNLAALAVSGHGQQIRCQIEDVSVSKSLGQRSPTVSNETTTTMKITVGQT